MGGATGLQGICGLAGLAIAARAVPLADLGAFVLMQVVVAFWLMVGDFALQGIAVTRSLAVAADTDGRRVTASTALAWKSLVAIPISIIVIAAGPPVASMLATPLLRPLSYYAALLLLLTGVDDIVNAILQGLSRFPQIAAVTAGSALLRLGLTALFVLVLGRGVWGLAEAYVVTTLFSVAVRLVAAADVVRWAVDRATLASLWRFGLPLSANGALTFLFTRVDRLVLGAFVGPAGVALYDVASRLPESLQKIYDAFRVIFLPSLAGLIGRGQAVAASHFVNTAIRVVSLCMALLALIVIALQAEVVELLFSAQYAPAGPVLGLLMVSLSVALVGNLLGTSLVAAGRADAPLKIGFVMAAVSLAGNLVFVPIWGPLGAAAAALTANVVTNFTASVWFIRQTVLEVPLGWAFTVGGGLALFWVVMLLQGGVPPHLRLLMGLVCLALPAAGLIVSHRRAGPAPEPGSAG